MQSASAIFSIKCGFIFLPALCVAAIAVLMARFPLDKEMPQVREELAAQQAASGKKEEQ